ncbi:MAG TPA: DUF4270 family protein [Chitinophagaceae bacterium]|nr:DUF4270 family protein [Chitinophagaceae bacterium]
MTIRLFRFILFSFTLLFLITSCKKINEATDLGDEIIPGVDGVNTFDTSLLVETYDSIFDPLKDSIRVGRGNDHILGNISNDPFFGKTNAKIFLELKPDSYPWNFSGVYKKDSLYIDSVVMVLGWNGTYGDTMAPQRVRVWEMDPSVEFRIDSFYTLRNEYFTHTTLLGTKDFFPYQLKDSVRAFQDTTAGQLRIRLNNTFGRRLLDYDTTNAYASDSAFKTYFRGFEVDADESFGGNALMAFGLINNPNTKLAIYYRYTKGGQDDTTVSYFPFNPQASAQHNYIERFNFTGTPLATAASTPGQDDIVYLINTPGSYTSVKIPGLRNLTNSVINRAELIVEQLFDPSDLTFTVPEALMLDVFDSTLGDYKFTPYDFTVDRSGMPEPSYGMYGKNTTDGFGNPIRVWKFNLTRYVQNTLTKREPVHNFRLFTAKGIVQRLGVTGGFTFYSAPINSQFAFGRIRVGGGNHATQRMRLRIIYTKI